MEDKFQNAESIAEQTADSIADAEAKDKRELSKRIDTVGWALFFIWVGIAFLLDVGLPAGLIGVGVLTLAEQVYRGVKRLSIEWFWVVVGILFLVGGIWDLTNTKVLIPVLLIVAGVVLLLSTFFRKTKK